MRPDTKMEGDEGFQGFVKCVLCECDGVENLKKFSTKI